MKFGLDFNLILLTLILKSKLAISSNPQVNTTSGLLIGVTHPETHSFYSVPFGEAPIGELRFKPPIPIENQGTINTSLPTHRKCFRSYANCVDDDNCDDNYSEDCLNLEINVPSTVNLESSSNYLLPVFFWIHGGAFSFGSATELKYDGRWLANSTNVIVVSTNYRLDALGCLVFDDEDEAFEGNQGIKDQQLALQWVNENIEKFGGNKNEVTIFGESAGGQSVTMHLMSSLSRPLFKRAIIQSYRAALSYETKEEAKAKTNLLLEAINCQKDKLDCLKNTPAYELMNAHSYVVDQQNLTFFDKTQPYRPVLDENEFPYPPLEFFQTGLWTVNKDVIIGITSDEAAYIKLDYENKILTKDMFIKESIYYAGPIFGPMGAEKYLEFVENPDDPNFDYSDLLAQEVTEMMFICPNRALARFMLQYGIEDLPVYLYAFDYAVNASNCEEVLTQLGDGVVQCRYPSHASELFYVFNSGPTTGLNLTENGKLVANMFSDFWGSFAHTGRPSNYDTVWPTYQEEPQASNIIPWTNVRITAPLSFIEHNYRSEICDFWDLTGFYVNITRSESTQTPEITTSSANYFLFVTSFIFIMGLSLLISLFGFQ